MSQAADTAKQFAIEIPWAGWSIDVPTGLLIAMFVLIAYVMVAAKLGTRWAEAFQDDGGKVSALRLSVFIACAVMSWHLIYVTMNVIKQGDDLDALFPFYAFYGAIWSGAKIAEKIVDVIAAKFGIKPAQQASSAGG